MKNVFFVLPVGNESNQLSLKENGSKEALIKKIIDLVNLLLSTGIFFVVDDTSHVTKLASTHTHVFPYLLVSLMIDETLLGAGPASEQDIYDETHLNAKDTPFTYVKSESVLKDGANMNILFCRPLETEKYQNTRTTTFQKKNEEFCTLWQEQFSSYFK